MLFGTTTDSVYFAVAVTVAAVAAIPGSLAVRRGRRTDERTSDLDTLREIVKTLQEENTDQRTRMNQLAGRIDRCELEKNALSSKIFELHLEIYRLKGSSG